jgi:hypothetical protein
MIIVGSSNVAEAGVPANSDEKAILTEVLQAIRDVNHGSVQLYVQDGRVVQIDTLEKRRLDRSAAAPPTRPQATP